jgi:signal transduction histidine kinase
VIELLRPKILRWSLLYEENVPKQIMADKERVTQVLTNILENAGNYTSKDQI